MRGDRQPVTVLGARLIPQINAEVSKELNLEEGERSIGILTTDCDDASYVAIDAATKMCPVRVAYARSMYAGSGNASTALAGEFIGILAGATPEDVRSGMEAAVKYLEGDCCFYSANEDDSIVYFAHCISRTGTYLSKECGIPNGAPLAYLIAPPMEAIIGMDAALKAADVTLVKFYGPPTETNFAGALLTGEQAACQAACDAFAQAVNGVAADPVSMR